MKYVDYYCNVGALVIVIKQILSLRDLEINDWAFVVEKCNTC